jgi:two-component system, OmpR family, response regulator ResD
MDSGQKKILLVEDEDFIRDLYVRQLSKSGFQVQSAADGTTGLNTLLSDNFDLVLLDIMLPGMNGLQILREYKTKNPTTKTIVILLTNLGQEAVIKEGFELGAQAYIIKASYTPDQVVNEVKNALAGQNTGGSMPPAGTPPTTGTPPTGTPPQTPPTA